MIDTLLNMFTGIIINSVIATIYERIAYMKIKVRFFSILKDVAGRESIELELPEGAKLRDLLEKIYSLYPDLEKISGEEVGVIALLNGNYGRLDDELGDGDEVALVPPASGG